MNSNAPLQKELVDADVWQVAEESSATYILDNTERANLPYDHRTCANSRAALPLDAVLKGSARACLTALEACG